MTSNRNNAVIHDIRGSNIFSAMLDFGLFNELVRGMEGR